MVTFARLFLRTDDLPSAAQVMAPTSSESAKVVIGPNVQVSAGNGTGPHREITALADPTDARRLFAAAILHPSGDTSAMGVVGYRSEDGGMTWQRSFWWNPPGEVQFDPALAHGTDGVLYLALMARPSDRDSPRSFHFFHSRDAGATWESGGVFEGGIDLDLPRIAVDGSSGPRRGQLYCASRFHLHSSSDQGRTFDGQTYNPGQTVDATPTAPIVLSDGKVVFAHRFWPADKRVRPGLRVLASSDGGRTVTELAVVTPRWRGEPFETGNYWFFPQLAADLSAGPFRDRLYAVWEDGNGPRRVRLLFSWSGDGGRTWVRPTILSEQPAGGADGYTAAVPSLAVNKDGAVAVAWYDRRGLPDILGENAPSYGNGRNVRIRVSLDGGVSWQPSVQVNDKPIVTAVWTKVDAIGLAADAMGMFHPVWLDDRNGALQVWTSSVKVGGQ